MAYRLATPADFPSAFDNVDSRDIRSALEEAASYVSEMWGDKMSVGHWLKAADILATSPSTRGQIAGLSAGGEVIEEEVGPVRVKYSPTASAIQANAAAGGQSEYGARYERLRNSIFVGPSLTH